MKPEKIIPKRISRALMEYDLIKEGDRVILALSGGKDSMAMAWFLSRMARSYPIPFTLHAVHVATPWEGEKLPLWIEETCQKWNVTLSIIPLELTKERDPDCNSCARYRRKALLTYAQENNFNKIALGHHMEDGLETFLINLVYHSRLDPLIPIRDYSEMNSKTEISLIRPLILLQEEILLKWSNTVNGAGPGTECPWESKKSRRREMRKNLELLTGGSPEKKYNMFKALIKDQTR